MADWHPSAGAGRAGLLQPSVWPRRRRTPGPELARQSPQDLSRTLSRPDSGAFLCLGLSSPPAFPSSSSSPAPFFLAINLFLFSLLF